MLMQWCVLEASCQMWQMEYHYGRCYGHIVMGTNVADGIPLWQMLWPQFCWQMLCDVFADVRPYVTGGLARVFISVGVLGFKQNLFPYMRQMVHANVRVKGWIVDPSVCWFFYVFCIILNNLFAVFQVRNSTLQFDMSWPPTVCRTCYVSAVSVCFTCCQSVYAKSLDRFYLERTFLAWP